jgi:hypothetical protein
MKNNTKVRLHLSKQLFESLTKEIIKEAKANDGYTVAVKQPKTPKQSKSQATSPEVQKTDAEAKMEGNVPTSTSTTSVQDMNAAGYGDKPAIQGLNEIDPGTIDWSVVAAGLGAIGLTPFLIDKIHNLWKKKFPKSFEKAQGLSGAIDRQASGNEPGDKDRQIKPGGF